MNVESDRKEAFKIGLVPVDQLYIGFVCVWFYDGKKMSDVIIKSPIVGEYGKERIRIDHILENDKTREGGYVNINELYEINKYLI